MKVIWQNSKSLQIGIENVGFGTNKSSRHALEKSRGYCALPQEPYQEEDRKWRKMKSSVEKRLESGESGDAVKQDGDSWKPSCRVCGRGDELQDLETCDHLLLNLFGVKVQDISAKVCRDCIDLYKVQDISAKVCRDCADLMQHTQKFKDMVCAAFRATSETSTLKDGSSVHSIIAKKRGSEDHFKTYPMPHATDDFVCCRCKITNSNDRTVTCVKCRSKVPSALMKEHLEIHATANLKGRCR
ncbi:hypothetical protein NE865_14323 [Phthorimaea operculella]|nr:hypothetical protein NE865_14323 [Phthorimaea operculella]